MKISWESWHNPNPVNKPAEGRTKELPPVLPSSSSDFALSKIASRRRLTECIDISWVDTISPLVRGFLCQVRSTIALVILGVNPLMSIPWNTWKAASKFPLWYSRRPSKALASWNSHEKLNQNSILKKKCRKSNDASKFDLGKWTTS